jgi:hypothetical protein
MVVFTGIRIPIVYQFGDVCPEERELRQDPAQRGEAIFDVFPFDAAAYRADGRIYATVLAEVARRGPTHPRSARRRD